MAAIGELFVAIKADVADAVRGLGIVEEKGKQAGKKVEDGADTAVGSFGRLKNAASALGVSLGALSVGTLITSITQAIEKMQELREALADTAREASQSLNQVTQRRVQALQAFAGDPVTAARLGAGFQGINELSALDEQIAQRTERTQGGTPGLGDVFSILGKSVLSRTARRALGLEGFTPSEQAVGQEFLRGVGLDVRGDALAQNRDRVERQARFERESIVRGLRESRAIAERSALESAFPELGLGRQADQQVRAFQEFRDELRAIRAGQTLAPIGSLPGANR